MALFKTSLRFATDQASVPARKWSNTFYIEAGSASIAAGVGRDMWTAGLRAAARSVVYCYQVYATDLVEGTTNYATLQIDPSDQRGSLSPAGLGESYLPKACIAVELLVPNSRPSRKFWRPGLFEADVGNGVNLAVGLVDSVLVAFQTVVTGIQSLRDPDGELISGVGSIRLTTREFGRESTNLVPVGPAQG